MVLVSEPDERGYESLGGDVVCSIGAIEVAKTIIGFVNKNVPFTYGDAVVPLTHFNHLVQDNSPLIETPSFEPTPIQVQIGKHCANLIDDGACLQVGVGGLTNALAVQLKDHKNLGLHTETFSDGVLELIKSGVINGQKKLLTKEKLLHHSYLAQEPYLTLLITIPV